MIYISVNYLLPIQLTILRLSSPMHNRIFGRQINNLQKQTNHNHIILKSRSFSIENQLEKPLDTTLGEKTLTRRQSFVAGLIKKNNRSLASIHNLNQKEKIDSDRSQNLEEKLLSMKQDFKNEREYIFDNIERMKNYEDHFFKLKLKKKHNIERLASKREKVIDWLAAIHCQLELFPETLFIAVAYLDLYLAQTQNVDENQVQKIAVTVLLMAGKFEETYRIPYIRNLLELTSLSLSKEEIKNMEEKIISVLDFQLIVQVPVKYLNLYSKMVGMSPKNKFIAMYILELSLLETQFLSFSPHLLGASVVYLVHKIRKISPTWPKYLEQLTGFKEDNLRQCAKLLCALLERPSKQEKGRKIKRKYSTAEYCQASKIRLQRKTNN